MSSQIGVAVSTDGKGWTISGSVSETRSTGHSGHAGKGPYFARQWRVPINYGYVRIKVHCLHGGGSYSYNAPNSRRGLVRPGMYFSPSSGHSMTYTEGATVFKIGISSQTMYNGTHTQKVEAGNKAEDHAIWGAKGTLYGKPGTFYSY